MAIAVPLAFSVMSQRSCDRPWLLALYGQAKPGAERDRTMAKILFSIGNSDRLTEE